MTLDTSALVAVLFAESGYMDLVDAILEADVVRVGAPTLVETSLVFSSRAGRTGKDALGIDPLIKELGITIAPFGEREWRRATEAFARYGRGRHKASLNFGDCLAYATASVGADSLLFVGDDFRHTDIDAAL